AHQVSVSYNDQTYQGCGRSLIRDVTWRLEDLDKTGVIDNSHITLTFGSQGRISGSAGCNNYNGGYVLEGETLTIGPNIAATMRACIAEALMRQEQTFLQTLPAMTKATIDETGALILSNEEGQTLLFRE